MMLMVKMVRRRIFKRLVLLRTKALAAAFAILFEVEVSSLTVSFCKNREGQKAT